MSLIYYIKVCSHSVVNFFFEWHKNDRRSSGVEGFCKMHFTWKERHSSKSNNLFDVSIVSLMALCFWLIFCAVAAPFFPFCFLMKSFSSFRNKVILPTSEPTNVWVENVYLGQIWVRHFDVLWIWNFWIELSKIDYWLESSLKSPLK